MIHYSKDILLNSKNEYNSNCLTRLTIDEKFEKKTRERLEAMVEAKEKEAWEQFKNRKRKEGFLKRKKEEIPESTRSKKPRWSTGDQEPATPTLHTGEESGGGQEEMADDLGICLERMEGMCMRAGRLRKQLEFDKMRMVRRMDTLEQDNILMDIHNILDEQQPGVEDGGGAHIEVAADQMMDDPVPEGRKTGKMILPRKRKEEIEIPDAGKVLGAKYPITTLHTRAPLTGKHEKPWYESMVGLVGWWRRVELESSRVEKNSRRVESKTVNTERDRKQREESKLNFLRRFYPECSKSPGGKTLKLIHTHKKSEFSDHPSDSVRASRLEELSFSPQAKRKAGGGQVLAELYSPSKRTKVINAINFFENGGLSDLVEPVRKLSTCADLETTKLVGKLLNK